MTSKRETALRLAAKGFRVFPLVPGSKTPAIDGWPRKASADPEVVNGFWRCPITGFDLDRDIGIATGHGLVVIDVDTKEGKNGEATYQQLVALYDGLPEAAARPTESGGRHYYFRTDKDIGNGTNSFGEHIDHRGEGGFVKFYGEPPDVGFADLHPLPGWAAEICGLARRGEEGARTTLSAVELDTEPAIARAIAYLETAEEAVVGSGASHRAYVTACRVKDFGISEPLCLELMLDHWNDRGAPPLAVEDLGQRVANAYRYGKNPVGVLDPHADFDVPAGPDADPLADFPIGSQPTTVRKHRLHYERFRDVVVDTANGYLVKGVLDSAAMSVIYGASNTGKSYFMIDLALSVARGVPWRGQRVRQGLVVYVAAEGGGGVRKRLTAYRLHHSLDDEDIPFALVPCSVDLLAEDGDLRALVDLVRQAEAEMGQKAALIVIDTLHRAMGGGDENAADDMGQMIRHLDALRQHTKAHISIVHHSGKDAAKGARGHSSLRAATDTEIEIANSSAKVTKQRDIEPLGPFDFHLASVAVGRDADGDAVTACVVKEGLAPETEFEMKKRAALPVGSKEAIFMECLENLIAREGFDAPSELGLPGGLRATTHARLREIWIPKVAAKGYANPAHMFRKAKGAMLAEGRIGNDDDRGLVWIEPN